MDRQMDYPANAYLINIKRGSERRGRGKKKKRRSAHLFIKHDIIILWLRNNYPGSPFIHPFGMCKQLVYYPLQRDNESAWTKKEQEEQE